MRLRNSIHFDVRGRNIEGGKRIGTDPYRSLTDPSNTQPQSALRPALRSAGHGVVCSASTTNLLATTIWASSYQIAYSRKSRSTALGPLRHRWGSCVSSQRSCKLTGRLQPMRMHASLQRLSHRSRYPDLLPTIIWDLLLDVSKCSLTQRPS